MKTKLTKLERNWILYDVGNSAFTLLVSTLFPIYFNAISDSAGIPSVNYFAYWGYATSIVTILVALTGPVLGTVTDYRGMKRPLFILALAVGAGGCCVLGFCTSWIWFLAVYILAKYAYSVSLIFYDSMINDVTTPERMDDISSRGFAWGYIGSCVPFLIGLVLVLFGENIGLGQMQAMKIAFAVSAAWWIGMTVPLLRVYRQEHYVEKEKKVLAGSFIRLAATFQEMKNNKAVFWFLVAFFCYIDGVYTIIDMATTYGTALGLDSTGLLLALLTTQIVAFPCALIFGKLSQKHSSGLLIPVCIAAYTLISVFAFFLDSQLKFWILAIFVGMFQGGIQALSRSHFGKLIPPEKSGEYFGLYDICGKGASFLGTLLVSVTSQLTGSVNMGIGSLILLFLVGMVAFRRSLKYGAENRECSYAASIEGSREREFI